jgi:hypothetical protein
MKMIKTIWGVALAFMLWGCAQDPPRYEAVAVVSYRPRTTDEKFETAFLRSETFLRIAFEELPPADVREFQESLGKNISRDDAFRRFVRQFSARVGAKAPEIEVCFLHTDPALASLMANHIVDVYLSGRSDQARLVRRAHPPQNPIKR